jgi:hypothetical protein
LFATISEAAIPVARSFLAVSVLDPFGQRLFHHIRGRVDSQHWNSALLEMLEQIAIVGSDLHDQRGRSEVEALGYGISVAPSMGDPRIGE